MKRIFTSKRRLMGTLILSFPATYSQEHNSLSRVHTLLPKEDNVSTSISPGKSWRKSEKPEKRKEKQLLEGSTIFHSASIEY